MTLQVRGLYRVRVDGGPERVVGVMRTNSVTGRAAPWEWGLGFGYAWQLLGTETCPLALEDHLVPGEDLAEARKDVEDLVDSFTPGKVGPKLLGEATGITPGVVKRCESEKAAA